jgi:putative FmdB family regulatory protein
MPDVVDASYLSMHLRDLFGSRAMPTYQYRCEACGEMFERAQHLAEHETAHPQCPKCGSEKVQHLPTQFMAKTSKKS